MAHYFDKGDRCSSARGSVNFSGRSSDRWNVTGSIPVGDSEQFVFVPRS